MNGQKRVIYEFDEFQLDLGKRRLLRSGEVVPLKQKPFDLLTILVENNGEMLTKEELFRLVWGDQFVEESNLTVSISAVRKALGEKASEPRYITNVSGRGYYFNAEFREVQNDDLVIERRSFSRIVVESEEIDDVPTIEGDAWRQLSPGNTHSRSRMFGVAVILVLGLIGGLYFLFARRISALPFQAHSISRLTTTGRILGAALSPDGRLYAYSQSEVDGKYTMWLAHMDGSAPLQLIQPTEKIIVSVSFAADSDRIYYVLFNNDISRIGTLFRMPVLGGVPEKIKDGVPNRVSFSPDGKQFVFVRDDPEGRRRVLIAVELESGVEREIAVISADIGTFTSTMAWSRDGANIAIATIVAGKDPTPNEIFTINTANGSIRQLTRQEWSTVRSIVWTKDSDGLIVAAGDGGAESERPVWYVPISGGEPQKIVADSNLYGSLNISVDNSVLLAVQTQTTSNIWVGPADNIASARQVTFDMLGKQAGWTGIDWTEDGHIVYTGRVGKYDSIWEMNADGSGQKQFIPENRTSNCPSLPDDGRFLIFSSNRSGVIEVWRASRDGTEIKQLTTGGENENPSVSPDGKYVVYHAGTKGGRSLYRITSDGGEPVRLTDGPADWARCSPDSRSIACAYDVDGKAKLAVISADGGPPQQIFEFPTTANFRLGVHWTPDGKYLTYRDWRNGIWRQSIAGGEPVRIEGLPSEKVFAYGWSKDGRSFAFTRGTAINDIVLMSNLK